MDNSYTKENPNSNPNQNNDPDQMMNRVNQSFDQMVQDVKEMINKNNEQ
ncbi:hypothetical protein HPT25_17745 [Bacillus sp. BRMEA1]|nr:hypothetical protein [Neobacillus endophyticus]NRD79205.1 hypothetical protein [Neobacillus endophyticus]